MAGPTAAAPAVTEGGFAAVVVDGGSVGCAALVVGATVAVGATVLLDSSDVAGASVWAADEPADEPLPPARAFLQSSWVAGSTLSAYSGQYRITRSQQGGSDVLRATSWPQSFRMQPVAAP